LSICHIMPKSMKHNFHKLLGIYKQKLPIYSAIIKLLPTTLNLTFKKVRQLLLIIHNQIDKMSIHQQHHSRDKWIEDMKGSISLTVSIIATMTFSLATNPPGGVVQVSLGDINQCSTINSTMNPPINHTICVGEAILATFFDDYYLKFLIFNTTCFIASLSVLLLLVSGIPINNKFSIWVLSIGMTIILSTLALTYLFAANLVTPNALWNSPGSGFGKALIVWVVIVVIVYIIRMLCACLSCCKKGRS